MNRSTLAIAAMAALVGLLAVPATTTAAADLSVGVEQAPETGEAVVTVTRDDTVVENATMTVTAESAYAGNGTYGTDANGTVVLPEPDGAASVTVNASVDDGTTSRTVGLVPRAAAFDVTANQSADGSTTVAVTQYDDPVTNASVDVDTDADGRIARNYTTDANDTVRLARPDGEGTATVEATAGNRSATTTVIPDGTDLDVGVDQRDDGVVVAVTDGGVPVENATVEVASDGDYSGTGPYATGTDGEVALPLPTETVTVEVTATADDQTATATADLTVDLAGGAQPFGLVVSRFVSALQNATAEGPPGGIISEFATNNNPGSADEAPGQSGDAPGNSGDGGDDDPGERNGEAPERAGPESDAGDDDGDENEESEDDESDDGTETPESDAAGREDDADGGGGEETDSDADDASESDADGDTGGDDEAPGNSGNAPGRN